MEKNIINKLSQLKSGDKIVVAVSGGVDSVVLLDILSKNFNKDSLVVAHVNHGIRKKSAKEAKFVANLAQKKGIAFEEKSLKLGDCSEEKARKCRYEFLQAVAKKHQAKYIALAHHADDQVETYLLKLTRGSGPINGWGMRGVEGNLWRPLLEVSKRQIVDYAKKKNIKHVVDKSNKNVKYSRNRIRNIIIPEFEKINPAFKEAILRNLRLGQELSDYLQQESEKSRQKVSAQNEIKIKEFLKLSSFVQKNIIREMLMDLVGSTEIYEKNIEAVLEIIKKPGNRKTEIAGFTIVKKYDKIVFGVKRKKNKKTAKLLPSKKVDFNGFLLESEIVSSARAQKSNILLPQDLADSLVVRLWEPGDKIKTKFGTKKIQDIFTDAKIPTEKRISWPVVVSGDKILWIPLLAASDLAISKSDNYCLKIEVKIEKS